MNGGECNNMSKQKVKTEYKLKDGTIVRVGDMVQYRYGTYPIGLVERIEKDYSRWYAHVHLLNDIHNHSNINVRLCDFQRSFNFINP